MARHQVQSRYICSVYLADGFADDCDELIHRCTQVNSLSYEKFCHIWKEMDFACIFHGRPLCSELAELSEEVLHIAKHYMVANTDNYEESVAGLFLVYALLHLQPLSKFASLRIVPEDVVAIERIQKVARQNRRLDVLYILGSVLITGSHYHAVQRERGMEYSIRKYLEGYTMDKQSIRPKGVFYRQNEELDIMRDLDRLSSSYKKAKENIIGPGRVERNLNYVNHNLATELEHSLKNVIIGVSSNDCTQHNADSDGEPSTAQVIKDKAMKMPVKGMAHLRAVDDVIPQGRKRKPEKSTKKVKGRTKVIPRKRKRLNSTDSDTTTDSDELVLTDSDEEPEVIDKVAPPSPEIQNVCEIEIIDEYADKDNNTITSALANKHELPILVETDEIQNVTDDRNIEPYVVISKVETSTPCDPLAPSGACYKSKPSDGEVAEVTKVLTDEVFKKPMTRVGKKDKCDLKKVKIKTKFERMGMSALANFKDKKEVKK